MVVQGNTVLGGGRFTGAGKHGTIQLSRAQIGGDLDLEAEEISNPDGPFLAADSLTVTGTTSIRTGTFTGTGDRGAVDLASARLGVLRVGPALLQAAREPGRAWDVDGLRYEGLPRDVDPGQWLGFLRHGTIGYAAQPYQQLAAGHRGAGHDGDVRKTLIEQRKDQLARANGLGWRSKTWGRVTGLRLGYGYRPAQALLFLAALVLLAVTACVSVPAALQHPTTPPITTQPDTGSATAQGCTLSERIEYALSVTVPLIPATTATCEPSPTTTGNILRLTSLALYLLAWSFLTLFIAGFTGAVRKT